MNKEQADLALAALAERHKAISPMYAELMGKFGELALNTATVDGLRQEEEVILANRGLIGTFIGELPHLEKDMKSFAVDTAQDARMLQASVIWAYTAEYNGWHTSKITPYYILGSKPIQPNGRREPDTSLLLISAGDDSHFTKAETWSTELRAIEAAFDTTLAGTYSDEQLKSMFDAGTGKLNVGVSDTDSIVFFDKYKTSQYPRNRAKLSSEQKVANKRKDRFSYRSVVGGGPLINTHCYLPNFSWSDETLVEYDVLDHMSDLATKFGKTEELKNLIIRCSIEPKDPMDKLLEEAGD
jgi:hypothetical protein